MKNNGKIEEPASQFDEQTLNQIRLANANCALANIRQAARVITQLFDEALQPAGIKATQFNILATLAIHQPTTVNELAEKLVMDRTTLARDLKPLERAGLLTIQVGEHDQRTRQISLTFLGQETVLKGAPLRQAIQNRVEAELGEREYPTMLALLLRTTRMGELS